MKYETEDRQRRKEEREGERDRQKESERKKEERDSLKNGGTRRSAEYVISHRIEKTEGSSFDH